MDLASLERSIRAASSGALIVDPRLIRRVIKRHRSLGGLGLQVPHARCYALDRDALLAIVPPSELGVDRDALPADVILLPRPDAAELRADDGADVLGRLWRASFHARVHVEIDRRFASGALTDAMIRERIHRVGQTEFDEIRRVLKSDDLLLPPHDERETYAEFAALWLEHRYFAPHLLPRIFPTLVDTASVDATLAEDVDAAALFDACRPDGARLSRAAPPPPPAPAPPPALAADAARALLPIASLAREKGNVVRSALIRLAAGEDEIAEAHRDLDALAARLRHALRPRGDHEGPDTVTEASWTPILIELAEHAVAPGSLFHRAEARLLYDLQSACLADEKAASAVDVIEWALSLGRRPVVRPLPATGEVRVARHLRSAAKKLAAIRVAPAARERLGTLLRRADENIRDVQRPVLTAVLREVGLRPDNVPERVAAKKVVEELLDRAVSHGFLSIGHVRDALSKNQLKMQDLAARELLSGDALLVADKRLSLSLDGVYRRGEIYLRGLQKMSSVAFGTRVGRVLVSYLVLPFLAAYVALEGATHLLHIIAHALHHHHAPHLRNNYSTLAVAAFVFGLLHSSHFRAGVRAVLHGIGWFFRAIFVRIPAFVASRPIVRAVVRSGPVRAMMRYVVKPFAITAIAWRVTPLHSRSPLVAAPITLGVFAVITIALNTRAGMLAEELTVDWVSRQWRSLRRRILPGLFRLVADAFRGLVELVERGIYTVDERLRFREGEGRFSLAAKAALGAVWFVLAYLVRIYTNLLLEPQVNPIKHFPVVTVSHKIILPFAGDILAAMDKVLTPVLGAVVANTIAAPTVLLLPGVFGFLVWELKENWRLYRATRAGSLQPIPIGHHGETMGALMKPGFHSGTLPKLYAKLRRAAMKEDGSAERHREALHDVEHAVQCFVERDLCALLDASDRWTGGHVRAGHVELASNRVKIELKCRGSEPCVVAFEEQSGFLVAGVTRAGWTSALGEDDRILFENALAGLYHLAGVELARESIEAAIAAPDAARPSYDVSDEGLVVWPDRACRTEIVYALDARATLSPVVRGEPLPAPPPSIPRDRIFFSDRPITWSAWVAAWSGPPRRLVEGPSLLPTPSMSAPDGPVGNILNKR